MSALAFDSLSYARRLQEAEFSREQADALAEERANLRDERLATRVDLEGQRGALSRERETSHTELTHDIEPLRAAVKRDIEALRDELQRWFVGIIGLQTITLLAALFGFVRVMAH